MISAHKTLCECDVSCLYPRHYGNQDRAINRRSVQFVSCEIESNPSIITKKPRNDILCGLRTDLPMFIPFLYSSKPHSCLVTH